VEAWWEMEEEMVQNLTMLDIDNPKTVRLNIASGEKNQQLF